MERELARRLLEAERLKSQAIWEAQQRMLEQPVDEALDEVSGVDQHQADSASDTYEREQTLTIIRLERERMGDIDLALSKVALDRYGRCETCADEIPDDRLLAQPAARFCEPHQRDWDLHRLLPDAPLMATPIQDSGEPGWRELASFPDPEDGEPIVLSAEERALHEELTGEWLTAGDLEAAEGQFDAEEVQLAEASDDAAQREQADAELAELEDERLGTPAPKEATR